MKGVEEINLGRKLLAVIFRANIEVDGVKFLTDEMNSFQIGVHNRKKGVKLTPHIHKIERPLKIDTIQEVLFVQAGKIRVNVYSTAGHKVSQKILAAGDSVLFLGGGHGVDFLEDSRVFQVKQGPYPGTVHAKIYLK